MLAALVKNHLVAPSWRTTSIRYNCLLLLGNVRVRRVLKKDQYPPRDHSRTSSRKCWVLLADAPFWRSDMASRRMFTASGI